MSSATGGRFAGFWQPIEAAAEALASASPPTVQVALSNLVDLLAADVIPRLRAEEKVLRRLISTESQSDQWIELNAAEVSRLTERLSSLANGPAGSNTGLIQRTASILRTVLKDQRQAENMLVACVNALPASERDDVMLHDRLESVMETSRASQVFVSDPHRLPTEAWALRHNPKAPRIERVAQNRPDPVADLMAALHLAE